MRRAQTILEAEEEDRAHVSLSQGFETQRLRCVRRARDGKEIMSYLGGGSRFADREEHPLTSLLLLDQRVTNPAGFDVLNWLQERPGLNSSPTTVFDPMARPRWETGIQRPASDRAGIFPLGHTPPSGVWLRFTSNIGSP
ncbi:MAG TPA: hypothetical protein VL793_03005 [Patescibacteria group bacterium]|nr:hypothetical protein [Patescibacteria group bacterium]